MTLRERQDRAFLDHLGCGKPELRELPEPVRATWARRVPSRRPVEVVGFSDFRFDDRPIFDGEETYYADQLQGLDVYSLERVREVEVEYEDHDNTITIHRRGVPLEELPAYMKADIVTGTKGDGRFQYRSSGRSRWADVVE